MSTDQPQPDKLLKIEMLDTKAQRDVLALLIHSDPQERLRAEQALYATIWPTLMKAMREKAEEIQDA